MSDVVLCSPNRFLSLYIATLRNMQWILKSDDANLLSSPPQEKRKAIESRTHVGAECELYYGKRDGVEGEM